MKFESRTRPRRLSAWAQGLPSKQRGKQLMVALPSISRGIPSLTRLCSGGGGETFCFYRQWEPVRCHVVGFVYSSPSAVRTRAWGARAVTCAQTPVRGDLKHVCLHECTALV